MGVTTPGQFYLVRFLLGIAEAGFRRELEDAMAEGRKAARVRDSLLESAAELRAVEEGGSIAKDLGKQYGIDVVSIVENQLVNEISQGINKHILDRAFALGWTNNAELSKELQAVIEAYLGSPAT